MHRGPLALGRNINIGSTSPRDLTTMKNTVRPRLEELENRLVPTNTTTGVAWPDPWHLTLSFAPDGSDIGGSPSALFSMLNQVASTPTWQREILRAVQTWADVASVNVSVIPDGGQPFGTPGAPQADSRFGDIRIGARPIAGSEASTGTHFLYTGSTWSGDIILNSNAQFGMNGAGVYDLFTAVLHEAGNAFDMLEIPDPALVMDPNYVGPRTGLSAGDTSAMQSLYGVRSDAVSNNSMANAATLSTITGAAQADADIASLGDVDYYKFQVPLTTRSMAVTVQTSHLSSLLANLTIYNSLGQVVGAAAATDPMNGNITVQVNNVSPLGGTYYVRVASNSTDAFGIGAYHLSAAFSSLSGPVTPLLAAPYVFANDVTAHDTLATALVLQPRWGTAQDPRFQYLYTGDVSNPNDGEYYLVQAPSATNAQNMVAMVWALDPSNPLAPRIDVFDGLGNPVNAQVLTNGNGSYTVQLTNAPSMASYFIRVSALNPAGPNNKGNYFLGVNFNTQSPVAYQNLAGAMFDGTTSTATNPLTVGVSDLFAFRLSAATAGGNSGESVQMTITDSQGNIILSLLATDGQPAVTANVYLQSGQYTVTYQVITPSGQAFTPIDYWFDILQESDPMGTYSSPPPPQTYRYC
jgi:hypothetical protein